MTLQDVKDSIDQIVQENQSQEITATLMNGLLHDIVTYLNNKPIGDIDIPGSIARDSEVENIVNDLLDNVDPDGNTFNKLYQLIQSNSSVYNSDSAITEDRVFDLNGNQITFKGLGDQAVLRLKESRAFFMGGLNNYIASKDQDIGYANNHIYSNDAHWVFWGASGKGWVQVGDHVSHTPTARLQVTGQGFFSSDRIFSVREANRVNDIFLVTGDEAVNVNAKSSGFTPGFQLKINGETRSHIDSFATRLFGSVYTESLNAHGNKDITISPQSGGGSSMVLNPWKGSFFFQAAASNSEPANNNTGFTMFIANVNGTQVPAYKLSDGNIVKLCPSDNIPIVSGGGNVDTECRAVVNQMLQMLKDNGLMKN